jgi:hypothetical protein
MGKRLLVLTAVLAISAFGLAPAAAARELHLRLRLPQNTAQFSYCQFNWPGVVALDAQGAGLCGGPQ